MHPVSIKKYFAPSSGEALDEADMRPVALGGLLQGSEEDEDDLSRAAMEYLNSVRQESARLPFAVVAEYAESPSVSLAVAEEIAKESELGTAIAAYFEALRNLLSKSNSSERTSCTVSFEAGTAEVQISCADQVTIEDALEDLIALSESLPESVFAEFLWCMLAYLELPLLEDTAANLQLLRRICEERPDNLYLQLCMYVIRDFFHQK